MTSAAPSRAWITDPAACGFTALTMDSRTAGPDTLFFAIRGARTDGHKYLADVRAAGCTAAVVETPDEAVDLPQLVVPSTPEALAEAAGHFYGNSEADLPFIAVTGTAGKTTTSTMIAAVLGDLLGPIGLVTTAGIYHPKYIETEMANTTPDAVTLHRTVRRLRELGSSGIVIETSSHGIEQRRIGGLPFRVAVFTNLSHEHLDYHGTMDAYAATKARLFADLPEDGTAVIRITDPWAERMLRDCRARVIGYGLADDLAVLDQTPEGAALLARCETLISADDLAPAPGGGLTFRLCAGGAEAARVQTPLVGPFNVENLAAAAAVAYALGYSLSAAGPGLTAFKGVEGRQERINMGQPFEVMVDFAHTPAALENLLKTLKPLTDRRLHLVLAVAGDRDRKKRPTMAAIAGEYADRLILTLQKTLGEDPDQIIGDLREGLGDLVYEVEPIRPAAIRRVMSDAGPGDLVIVIGVMSRSHLDMGGTAVPYDDHAAIRLALSERLIRDRLNPTEFDTSSIGE